MVSDEIVFGLIERVYAAGCDPAEWPRFVVEMQMALPGSAVATHLALNGTTLAERSAVAGVPDESIRSYYAHYQFINPYTPLFHRFKIGRIERLSDLMSVREIKRHPFYHEWLKPAGDFTYGVGLTLHCDSERLLRMAIEIPDRHSELETKAADLLTKLGPHVQRAFALNDRLAATAVAEAASSALMDAVEGAAFIVSADGRVLTGNAEAEAMVAAGALCGHGLDNRLFFRQSQPQEAYFAALASVTDPARLCHANAFTTNVDGEAVTVTVLPLTYATHAALSSLRQRLALVCITRAGDNTPPPASLLRSLYGLTKSEAEIACRLAGGADATEIADQTQVSRTTVRNQINAAMGKMDVHRQAELVAKAAAVGPRLKLRQKQKR
jgi:DNA-binding CsgD family transcriptional regulator